MSHSSHTPEPGGSDPAEVVLRVVELPDGYTSSSLVEHDLTIDELFDFLMVTHIVVSKDAAPCLLPCTLKARPGKRTKSGRRRATDADVANLLIFDLDHGNIEESDLEAALVDLDVIAVMYPTWKSGSVYGMRWRVIIPLARSVPGGGYKSLWIKMARAIERGLYAQGCFRPEQGWIDWTGKTVTQPAILPCCPASGADDEDFGGTRPKVYVLDDGQLLEPGDVPEPPQVRTERKKLWSHRDAKPRPYKATLNDAGVEAFEAMARRETPHLLASLDAVEVARRDGLAATRGTGHAALSGVCFALYRTGAPLDDISVLIDDVLIASSPGGDRARRKMEHTAERLDAYWLRRGWAEDAAVPEILHAVTAEADVPPLQLSALERYARILARYRTLRRPGGGRVDHGAVASIIGLPVEVVTAWRGLMERAGLVWAEGEGQCRRYELRVAAVRAPECESELNDVLPAAAM